MNLFSNTPHVLFLNCTHTPHCSLFFYMQGLMWESVRDDLHPADAELTADWKENKHHLSLDHDAMMTEQNPEQDAASSASTFHS